MLWPESHFQGQRVGGLEEEQPRACSKAADTLSAGQGSPWSGGDHAGSTGTEML